MQPEDGDKLKLVKICYQAMLDFIKSPFYLFGCILHNLYESVDAHCTDSFAFRSYLITWVILLGPTILLFIGTVISGLIGGSIVMGCILAVLGLKELANCIGKALCAPSENINRQRTTLPAINTVLAIGNNNKAPAGTTHAIVLSNLQGNNNDEVSNAHVNPAFPPVEVAALTGIEVLIHPAPALVSNIAETLRDEKKQTADEQEQGAIHKQPARSQSA